MIFRTIIFCVGICLAFRVNAQQHETPKSNVYPSMSEMVGQMIMVGIAGHEPEKDALLMSDIAAGRLGGIIIYEKNITPDNSWVNLKRLIHSLKSKSPTPLWVAIDQEGGKVNRLRTKYGFPPSRSAQYLGALPLDSTTFYAELTAATLSALGINVNFSPVVDVAINPANPVIAMLQRSFSEDDSMVSVYAKEVIRIHQKHDILTAIKHFPGHGSSTSDTHLDLTDVTRLWRNTELNPYISLISNGYEGGVMTAHIINEKLDPLKLPATLSKRIIHDLLRGEIGFNGVVFSDDMHMAAIKDHYGQEEAVKMTIEAGVDVLLFSNNISNANQSAAGAIHSYILELVEKDEIPAERIRESYLRIMKAKEIIK